jgi:hypothetical protein
MPKVIVITDTGGRVLGSVRADQIETESGTLQGVDLGLAPARSTGTDRAAGGPAVEVQYHEIELSEDLLGSPAEDLHAELARRVGSGPAAGG